MIQTLIEFGFRPQDAQVYVFLAVNGSQKVKTIADNLKIQKRHVYRILERLQTRQIVKRCLPPTQFSAIAFDKVLDLLEKTNIEEANHLKEKKPIILELWKSAIESK
jgi:sugar-specific transcriptional regulator TrmB